MSSPGIERREVHYSGTVQGVGFRYTTRRIAGHYDVTGFVRNLDDGRVQLVVEGTSGQLDAMIRDLDQAMERYIQNADVMSCDGTGEFAEFRIAF